MSQERLAAAMPSEVCGRAVKCWVTLAEMAAVLKLPVTVSEQYPKGLGPTLPVLAEVLGRSVPPARFFEKIDFSCCESPLFEQALGTGKKSWIVCGMETHAWRLSGTVRGLVERGYSAGSCSTPACRGASSTGRVGGGSGCRAPARPPDDDGDGAVRSAARPPQGDEFRALSRLVK